MDSQKDSTGGNSSNKWRGIAKKGKRRDVGLYSHDDQQDDERPHTDPYMPSIDKLRKPVSRVMAEQDKFADSPESTHKLESEADSSFSVVFTGDRLRTVTVACGGSSRCNQGSEPKESHKGNVAAQKSFDTMLARPERALISSLKLKKYTSKRCSLSKFKLTKNSTFSHNSSSNLIVNSDRNRKVSKHNKNKISKLTSSKSYTDTKSTEVIHFPPNKDISGNVTDEKRNKNDNRDTIKHLSKSLDKPAGSEINRYCVEHLNIISGQIDTKPKKKRCGYMRPSNWKKGDKNRYHVVKKAMTFVQSPVAKTEGNMCTTFLSNKAKKDGVTAASNTASNSALCDILPAKKTNLLVSTSFSKHYKTLKPSKSVNDLELNCKALSDISENTTKCSLQKEELCNFSKSTECEIDKSAPKDSYCKTRGTFRSSEKNVTVRKRTISKSRSCSPVVPNEASSAKLLKSFKKNGVQTKKNIQFFSKINKSTKKCIETAGKSKSSSEDADLLQNVSNCLLIKSAQLDCVSRKADRDSSKVVMTSLKKSQSRRLITLDDLTPGTPSDDSKSLPDIEGNSEAVTNQLNCFIKGLKTVKNDIAATQKADGESDETEPKEEKTSHDHSNKVQPAILSGNVYSDHEIEISEALSETTKTKCSKNIVSVHKNAFEKSEICGILEKSDKLDCILHRDTSKNVFSSSINPQSNFKSDNKEVLEISSRLGCDQHTYLNDDLKEVTCDASHHDFNEIKTKLICNYIKFPCCSKLSVSPTCKEQLITESKVEYASDSKLTCEGEVNSCKSNKNVKNCSSQAAAVTSNISAKKFKLDRNSFHSSNRNQEVLNEILKEASSTKIGVDSKVVNLNLQPLNEVLENNSRPTKRENLMALKNSNSCCDSTEKQTNSVDSSKFRNSQQCKKCNVNAILHLTSSGQSALHNPDNFSGTESADNVQFKNADQRGKTDTYKSYDGRSNISVEHCETGNGESINVNTSKNVISVTELAAHNVESKHVMSIDKHAKFTKESTAAVCQGFSESYSVSAKSAANVGIFDKVLTDEKPVISDKHATFYSVKSKFTDGKQIRVMITVDDKLRASDELAINKKYNQSSSSHTSIQGDEEVPVVLDDIQSKDARVRGCCELIKKSNTFNHRNHHESRPSSSGNNNPMKCSKSVVANDDTNAMTPKSGTSGVINTGESKCHDWKVTREEEGFPIVQWKGKDEKTKKCHKQNCVNYGAAVKHCEDDIIPRKRSLRSSSSFESLTAVYRSTDDFFDYISSNADEIVTQHDASELERVHADEPVNMGIDSLRNQSSVNVTDSCIDNSLDVSYTTEKLVLSSCTKSEPLASISVKRKRGRPRKKSLLLGPSLCTSSSVSTSFTAENTVQSSDTEMEQRGLSESVRRRRGKPAKNLFTDAACTNVGILPANHMEKADTFELEHSDSTETVKNTRGRPITKQLIKILDNDSTSVTTNGKTPARPRITVRFVDDRNAVALKDKKYKGQLVKIIRIERPPDPIIDDKNSDKRYPFRGKNDDKIASVKDRKSSKKNENDEADSIEKNENKVFNSLSNANKEHLSLCKTKHSVVDVNTNTCSEEPTKKKKSVHGTCEITAIPKFKKKKMYKSHEKEDKRNNSRGPSKHQMKEDSVDCAETVNRPLTAKRRKKYATDNGTSEVNGADQNASIDVKEDIESDNDVLALRIPRSRLSSDPSVSINICKKKKFGCEETTCKRKEIFEDGNGVNSSKTSDEIRTFLYETQSKAINTERNKSSSRDDTNECSTVADGVNSKHINSVTERKIGFLKFKSSIVDRANTESDVISDQGSKHVKLIEPISMIISSKKISGTGSNRVTDSSCVADSAVADCYNLGRSKRQPKASQKLLESIESGSIGLMTMSKLLMEKMALDAIEQRKKELLEKRSKEIIAADNSNSVCGDITIHPQVENNEEQLNIVRVKKKVNDKSNDKVDTQNVSNKNGPDISLVEELPFSTKSKIGKNKSSVSAEASDPRVLNSSTLDANVKKYKKRKLETDDSENQNSKKQKLLLREGDVNSNAELLTCCFTTYDSEQDLHQHLIKQAMDGDKEHRKRVVDLGYSYCSVCTAWILDTMMPVHMQNIHNVTMKHKSSTTKLQVQSLVINLKKQTVPAKEREESEKSTGAVKIKKLKYKSEKYKSVNEKIKMSVKLLKNKDGFPKTADGKECSQGKVLKQKAIVNLGERINMEQDMSLEKNSNGQKDGDIKETAKHVLRGILTNKNGTTLMNKCKDSKKKSVTLKSPKHKPMEKLDESDLDLTASDSESNSSDELPRSMRSKKYKSKKTGNIDKFDDEDEYVPPVLGESPGMPLNERSFISSIENNKGSTKTKAGLRSSRRAVDTVPPLTIGKQGKQTSAAGKTLKSAKKIKTKHPCSSDEDSNSSDSKTNDSSESLCELSVDVSLANKENIPLVELDMYTFFTGNDQPTFLLMDPKNPKFKIYANMDTIFVSDVTLTNGKKQSSYITDNNNIIYVGPNHNLFPNAKDLENHVPKPIIVMKTAKIVAPLTPERTTGSGRSVLKDSNMQSHDYSSMTNNNVVDLLSHLIEKTSSSANNNTVKDKLESSPKRRLSATTRRMSKIMEDSDALEGVAGAASDTNESSVISSNKKDLLATLVDNTLNISDIDIDTAGDVNNTHHLVKLDLPSNMNPGVTTYNISTDNECVNTVSYGNKYENLISNVTDTVCLSSPHVQPADDITSTNSATVASEVKPAVVASKTVYIIRKAPNITQQKIVLSSSGKAGANSSLLAESSADSNSHTNDSTSQHSTDTPIVDISSSPPFVTISKPVQSNTDDNVCTDLIDMKTLEPIDNATVDECALPANVVTSLQAKLISNERPKVNIASEVFAKPHLPQKSAWSFLDDDSDEFLSTLEFTDTLQSPSRLDSSDGNESGDAAGLKHTLQQGTRLSYIPKVPSNLVAPEANSKTVSVNEVDPAVVQQAASPATPNGCHRLSSDTPSQKVEHVNFHSNLPELSTPVKAAKSFRSSSSAPGNSVLVTPSLKIMPAPTFISPPSRKRYVNFDETDESTPTKNYSNLAYSCLSDNDIFGLWPGGSSPDSNTVKNHSNAKIKTLRSRKKLKSGRNSVEPAQKDKSNDKKSQGINLLDSTAKINDISDTEQPSTKQRSATCHSVQKSLDNHSEEGYSSDELPDISGGSLQYDLDSIEASLDIGQSRTDTNDAVQNVEICNEPSLKSQHSETMVADPLPSRNSDCLSSTLTTNVKSPVICVSETDHKLPLDSLVRDVETLPTLPLRPTASPIKVNSESYKRHRRKSKCETNIFLPCEANNSVNESNDKLSPAKIPKLRLAVSFEDGSVPLEFTLDSVGKNHFRRLPSDESTVIDSTRYDDTVNDRQSTKKESDLNDTSRSCSLPDDTITKPPSEHGNVIVSSPVLPRLPFDGVGASSTPVSGTVQPYHVHNQFIEYQDIDADLGCLSEAESVPADVVRRKSKKLSKHKGKKSKSKKKRREGSSSRDYSNESHEKSEDDQGIKMKINLKGMTTHMVTSESGKNRKHRYKSKKGKHNITQSSSEATTKEKHGRSRSCKLLKHFEPSLVLSETDSEHEICTDVVKLMSSGSKLMRSPSDDSHLDFSSSLTCQLRKPSPSERVKRTKLFNTSITDYFCGHPREEDNTNSSLVSTQETQSPPAAKSNDSKNDVGNEDQSNVESGLILESQRNEKEMKEKPVATNSTDTVSPRQWLQRGAKLRAAILIQDQQGGITDSCVGAKEDLTVERKSKRSLRNLRSSSSLFLDKSPSHEVDPNRPHNERALLTSASDDNLMVSTSTLQDNAVSANTSQDDRVISTNSSQDDLVTPDVSQDVSFVNTSQDDGVILPQKFTNDKYDKSTLQTNVISTSTSEDDLVIAGASQGNINIVNTSLEDCVISPQKCTDNKYPEEGLTATSRDASLVKTEPNVHSPKADCVVKRDSSSEERVWRSRTAKLRAQVLISDQQSGITNTSVSNSDTNLDQDVRKTQVFGSSDIRKFFQPKIYEPKVVSPDIPNASPNTKSRQREKLSKGDIRAFFLPKSCNNASSENSAESANSTPTSKLRNDVIVNSAISLNLKRPREDDVTAIEHGSNSDSTSCPPSSKQSRIFSMTDYNIPVSNLKLWYELRCSSMGFLQTGTTVARERCVFEGFPQPEVGDPQLTMSARVKGLRRFVALINMKNWYKAQLFSVPADHICNWDEQQLVEILEID